MSKKKSHKKHTTRELNSFPFLSISLEERLKLSGASKLNNKNSSIEINEDYWKIVKKKEN